MKFKYLILIVLINWISNQIYGQNKIKPSTSELLILDAHTHHGFSELGKGSICEEMKYLKNMGYDAIVYQLPLDRSKKDRLSAECIRGDIAKIKELSKQSECFQVMDSFTKLDDKLPTEAVLCSFSIEYFHGAFDEDLTVVKKYKNLGIDYITLIESSKGEFFDTESGKLALTEFGKDIIHNLNEVNIKMDITHLNEIQMLEVIRYSKAPVLASHSNIKGDTKISYNLSDEVLLALKKNKGLVLLSFNTNGLYSRGDMQVDPIGTLANQIDYLKKMNGINSIGIGTDLQAYGKYVPKELNQSDTFQRLRDELVKRDYSDQEIERIFYKNYIEFMR